MVIDLLSPNGHLIVGVEQDSDEPELTRVYLDDRAKWHYVLVEGEQAEKVKAAWDGAYGHLTTTIPPGTAIYVDTEAVNRK